MAELKSEMAIKFANADLKDAVDLVNWLYDLAWDHYEPTPPEFVWFQMMGIHYGTQVRDDWPEEAAFNEFDRWEFFAAGSRFHCYLEPGLIDLSTARGNRRIWRDGANEWNYDNAIAFDVV